MVVSPRTYAGASLQNCRRHCLHDGALIKGREVREREMKRVTGQSPPPPHPLAAPATVFRRCGFMLLLGVDSHFCHFAVSTGAALRRCAIDAGIRCCQSNAFVLPTLPSSLSWRVALCAIHHRDIARRESHARTPPRCRIQWQELN